MLKNKKQTLKWLAFLVASITIPAALEIKIASVGALEKAEKRTKNYVDDKHNQVIDKVETNHEVIIQKLNEMHDNIKTLDGRVYQLNERK